MINIIAAAAKNGVIGDHGRIPWDIPEDRKYFSRLTRGGAVIMGRRTYEEIGSPLPDRYNIVVSASRTFSGRMLCTARDLNEAIRLAEEYISGNDNSGEIFLCGGSGIYSKGLKIADRIYLTELDDDIDGDTFFPAINEKDFRLLSRRHRKDLRLSFCVYERWKTGK